MNEQIAATSKIIGDVMARSQLALDELVKTGRQQAEKAGQSLKADMEEMTDLGQKNLDAMVTSGKTFVCGLGEASRAAVAFSRKSSEASMEMLRRMMQVKTVAEAADIQQLCAKNGVAALASEGESQAALAAATTRSAIAPIGEQVTATADFMARKLAA